MNVISRMSNEVTRRLAKKRDWKGLSLSFSLLRSCMKSNLDRVKFRFRGDHAELLRVKILYLEFIYYKKRV